MRSDREPLSERRGRLVPSAESERTDASVSDFDEQRTQVSDSDAVPVWERSEAGTVRSAPPPTHAGSGRVAMIGVGLGVVVAVLLMLGFRSDSELSYELRGGSRQGGLIEARRGEATVSLSDGSSILAENQTRFSMDLVGKNAALARLESGKLHVRVEHHHDSSYRFLAGPYEVRVVGTEFDLSWEPTGAGLALAMSRGEVQVASPDGKLRTLSAGQTLRLPAVVSDRR